MRECCLLLPPSGSGRSWLHINDVDFSKSLTPTTSSSVAWHQFCDTVLDPHGQSIPELSPNPYYLDFVSWFWIKVDYTLKEDFFIDIQWKGLLKVNRRLSVKVISRVHEWIVQGYVNGDKKLGKVSAWIRLRGLYLERLYTCYYANWPGFSNMIQWTIYQELIPIEKSRNSLQGNRWGPGTARPQGKWSLDSQQLPSWELWNFSVSMDSCFYPMTH